MEILPNFTYSRESIDENNMISCDLKFSQKCIQLLEKYRKCLMDFRNRCICEQNIESESDFNVLENDFKDLIDEQNECQKRNANIGSIKSENIHVFEVNQSTIEPNYIKPNFDFFDEEVNDNSDDNYVSDEEYTPKTRAVNKRAITKTNGLKKEKKSYYYYNFVCDWIGCEKKFPKKDELMAHISSCHTKEKSFKCDVCSKTFSIEKYLRSHQISRSHFTNPSEVVPKRKYVCNDDDCDKVFTTTSNLKKHQRTAHSDLRPYICDWPGCSASYKIKESLTNHRDIHSDERQFKCDNEGCLKTFQTKWGYYKHINTHKTHKKIKITPDERLVCDIDNCEKVFRNQTCLRKHQTQTHSNEKPFICEWPGCDASYKTNDSLVNHKAIHLDEPQFQCDVEGCLRTFQTKWSYNSHMRIHKERKPSKYICDWPGCQHDSRNKKDLIIHRNRHMNIKPFSCQWEGCQMSYYTDYELKQHIIKVHEVVNKSDRQFKCPKDGCHMSYAVDRDLKRHLRRHDRIHVCTWPECGQTYAARQLLLDHMDRHMNKKSFHCLAVGCGKSFFSKNNFGTHMKRMHKM